MARIGLKYIVAAAITAETLGSAPTYGTGFVVGKAMKAEKSVNANDSELYGDDALNESDQSFSDGALKIGLTDFGTGRLASMEVQAALFGAKIVEVSGVKEMSRGAGQTAPYLGIGYYKTKTINKTKFYEATWIYKIQFKTPGESTNTRGKTIEFQTDEIEGKFMAVAGFGDDDYEKTATFETEAEAVNWLNALANISSSVSKTALASSITTATAIDAEDYTSASYAEMYVTLLNAQAVNANVYAGQTQVDAAKSALDDAVDDLVERT